MPLWEATACHCIVAALLARMGLEGAMGFLSWNAWFLVHLIIPCTKTSGENGRASRGAGKGQETPCPFWVFPVGRVPHSEFIYHRRWLNCFTNKGQRGFGFVLLRWLPEHGHTCLARGLVLDRSELAEWICVLWGTVPPRVPPQSPRKVRFLTVALDLWVSGMEWQFR